MCLPLSHYGISGCTHTQKHKIREKFVADLDAKFPDLGLKFSIGKN